MLVPDHEQLNEDNISEYDGTSVLTFTCNGACSDFLGLMIDDEIVDAEYYTVVEGSTIVTVSKEYLDKLAPGQHTLTMLYTNNRSISTVFLAATENQEVITLPTTGENPTTIFMAFAALAMGGALLLIRKKYYAK